MSGASNSIQVESLMFIAGMYTSRITRRGNWDGSSDSEEEIETRNKHGRTSRYRDRRGEETRNLGDDPPTGSRRQHTVWVVSLLVFWLFIEIKKKNEGERGFTSN